MENVNKENNEYTEYLLDDQSRVPTKSNFLTKNRF